MNPNLIRVNQVYDLAHVLSRLRSNKAAKHNYIDGFAVKLNSKRLLVFKRYGVQCIACKKTANIAYLERPVIGQDSDRENRFHFNFYIRDEIGRETLMTVDHTRPKARGGTNRMSNLRPMCQPCNTKKGCKIPAGAVLHAAGHTHP